MWDIWISLFILCFLGEGSLNIIEAIEYFCRWLLDFSIAEFIQSIFFYFIVQEISEVDISLWIETIEKSPRDVSFFWASSGESLDTDAVENWNYIPKKMCILDDSTRECTRMLLFVIWLSRYLLPASCHILCVFTYKYIFILWFHQIRFEIEINRQLASGWDRFEYDVIYRIVDCRCELLFRSSEFLFRNFQHFIIFILPATPSCMSKRASYDLNKSF